jgi:prepilin-type N-terminal cleavage/methylation domain-containing protein
LYSSFGRAKINKASFKEITVKKGFTLIELLIVVAIIAILAAIAVPNFLEAQVRAKVSRAKSDMRSIATAIESYVVDNNRTPPFIARGATANLAGSVAPNSLLNGPSVFYAGTPGVSSRYQWVTTPIAYITSVFQDPFINSAVRFALSPNGTPNAEYDTYDYVDSLSSLSGGWTSGSGTGGHWTSTFRGASLSSGASWHVVSAGPDKINAFGGGRTNNGTDNDQRLGADYDPTNGTISAGDIVRVSSGAGEGTATGGKPRFDRIRNKVNNFGETNFYAP